MMTVLFFTVSHKGSISLASWGFFILKTVKRGTIPQNRQKGNKKTANKGEQDVDAVLNPNSKSEYNRLQSIESIPVKEGIVSKLEGKSGIQSAVDAFAKEYPNGAAPDTVVGKVKVNKKGIKNSLSHLQYAAKYDTVVSLPEGLKVAAYMNSVPDINGQNITNHFLVYPIQYKGKRQYVVCRVRETIGGRSFYIHGIYSVEDIEKKIDALSQTQPPSNGKVQSGGTALYDSIIANFFALGKTAEGNKNEVPVSPRTESPEGANVSKADGTSFGSTIPQNQKEGNKKESNAKNSESQLASSVGEKSAQNEGNKKAASDGDRQGESSSASNHDNQGGEVVVTEDENISNGRTAIEKILKTHGEVKGAMERPEIGLIDFLWGQEGTDAKKHKDGFGIAKILLKHGKEAVAMIPEVIARGKYEKSSNGDRAYFVLNGYRAVVRLTWDGKDKTWLVTNFLDKKIKNPDDADAFVRSTSTTDGTISPPEQDSSSDSTIPQNQQKGNQKSTSKHSESQGAFSIGKINGKHQAKLETQLVERYVAELGTIAKKLGGTANKGKKTFTFKDRNSLDAFLKEANAYVSLADPDTMAKLSISAYHGSPNDFETFSLDHIGEGEGTQVHGWGLYFAGERKISEKYRLMLNGGITHGVRIDGKVYHRKELEDEPVWLDEEGNDVWDYDTMFADFYAFNEYDKEKTIEAIEKYRKQANTEKADAFADRMLSYFDEHKVEAATPGSLFQVEIPDEDVLLDEQKNLLQQSDKVWSSIQAINDFLSEKIGEKVEFDALRRFTGKEFYDNVEQYFREEEGKSKKESAKAASELLNEYGIKGITYDGRQDGRCYVVFDDQAIDIIGKFSASGEIKKILAGIQIVNNEELNSQQRKISEIGEAMGVPVVRIDADSRLNGFHQKGVTFLNRKAGMSLQKTFWHEQFHWLRNNNDDLWRELLTYFKGKAAFTKEQIEGYRKKTGRYDLTTDEEVIEEMLADAFLDVKQRVPIMKELARDDRSLAQKLVAWIKDMMNRFVEMFHNPEGRLTTEQRDIFVEAFGKLARDMVDADGKKIFKVYDDGKTIRLADGSELAGVRLSTGKKKLSIDNSGKMGDNVIEEVFERAKQPRYLRIINDNMNYEEVVERLLEPENIAVSRALSLYEIRERNNDSTTIPGQKLKAFLQVADTRKRALKDERGRKTLHEILRQHGRIREGSNLERTLSGRDIQGIRLSDGTNRQSGIDVKIPDEFGSLYEHAVVKELLQEISEESRKSVKASANLNNDTIKRSEKSASSMPKNKLTVSEKPSRTGNRKSTFFTVDSDLMDVSGHIPENGIPFIDNLWYKDEYAADPTDLSTVSPKVLRKGNATNHVLAVIDYLKDKGYDKFQIKTMSEYSEALMESMEEKGYVKALSKWRNEGDNVTYQILKTRRSKDSTAGMKFSINASDNSTPSLAHRIKNILAGTLATAQAREQYRRKMARMIEDALGVKIRTGKLDVGRPENGTVVYKEKDKVIRSLHAYDWKNILPMASGLMAERLGIVGKAADTTAAMRNYISTWILTGAPNNTSVEADTFHRAMQEHPHFADRMLAIREQFQEWADKSTQEQMRGTVQWTKEKSSTWKERKNLLYEELVKELAPVEDMVKQYEQETGEKLEVSINPMTAFRLLRGAHGRAITMIEGVGQAAVDGLKANFPNINFDGFKTLRTILDEIGALQNQEKQQDFAAYCVAKHILDMHRKNRQNRLEQEKLEYQVDGMREQVKEDTQKVKKMKERLALYQGEMKELRRLERRIESNKNKIREAEKRIESLKDSIYETPEAFTEENCEKYIRYGREEYDQAQKDLVHFSNTTAAILADSGVISNKRYQELLQSWPNYVPLFRVFEENKDIDFGDSMKRIKGSMRDIVNPLESIVHNTVEFVKKAEKNKAKSLLADFARCDGTGWLIEEVDNNSPNTETVITFYENGQRKYLETDPSIVKAVNNMDRRNSNAVLKFLHAITSVARACFTMASPEFAFRNIFRDYADATVYNKFGFISPMDLARGFWHAFRRDNVYYEWLSSGAAQASAVSLDRNYTQEMIDKLSRSMAKRTKHGAKDVLLGAWTATRHLSPIKGIGQSYQGAKSIGSVILEGPQKGSEYSEYATRIAMYEKAKAGLNKGRTRQDAMNALIGAAFESRDLMDFSRHGKAGSFWNKLVPFANASIQGMNKFYRTLDWRNGNKKQAVRAFVRLAISSILPATLLFLMNHDDDWFKELPDWVKETHWVFKVGDTIIRIPKGSDVGIRFLSNAVEKGMAEAFNHDRVKATEYFMPLYDSLPNFLPIAILPLLEASLNRSTFTGRNIVPQYQEKFTPKMQYGPYTTGMAKFLGEKLGVAPSKIDHVITGYTGSIGMAPWKFLDVFAGDRQLDTSVTELPLTRALTYMPYKNPKSVQKYYEELDEQTKLENEFKMTHKRPEGFDPALLQRLKDSKKQMSVLSKQERDLINNPNLTMDERKRRQFVIQQRRIRLVERIIK